MTGPSAPRHNRQGALDLRRICAGRFAVARQPVVSAADPQKVLFEECLIRVQNPDGVSRSGFSAVLEAEATGQTAEIDIRMLRHALGALERDPSARLSVNVSALSLNCARWRNYALAALAQRSDAAQRLILEVTETCDLTDLTRAAQLFECLEGLGVTTAIDDFGAGYSSFQKIKALKPGILKLDGDLIENADCDMESRAIARAATQLAHDIGALCVAERVGDAATANALRAVGVDAFQSFYFGAPKVSLALMEDRSPL